MRAKKPKIRIRINAAGSKSYQVDAGKQNGKRIRFSFATKQEAENKAQQLQIERANYGLLAFELNDRQRREAASCFEKLAPLEASLTEAVEFYLRHAKPRGGNRTCDQVARELIDSKQKSGKKPRYIKALRVAFGVFNQSFGSTLCNEVTRHKIEEWIDAQNHSMTTRRNYLRDLSILFGFAASRGYCAENVVRGIERPTLDDKSPEILSVEQATRLLRTAEHHPQLEMLTYVCLGLFTGLRASELEALEWQNIHWDTNQVEVPAKKAKTRQRRFVEISDNLRNWLQPFAKSDGRIAPSATADKFERLRKLAGFEKWPKNALRHSFASYHLAQNQDAGKTALQLGHRDTNMLFQHYRELVKAKDAASFWKIQPTAKYENGMILFAQAA